MAHILVVDDDRDLCALLRTALERDGHTVTALHSGDAVTERHCAWADCILLDVMMPGEDGFAACRRLRALADCPILFLTARTGEAEFQDALQTMDALRGDLARSLKAQWAMEQQRSERIAALAHDLKTPLAILQGNAELLAEEPLTDTQRPAVEAMLRGCERAGQYLAALRRVCRMEEAPAPAERLDGAAFVRSLAQTGHALCTPRRLHFVLDNALPPGTVLYARRQDTARAVENLLDNAVRYAAPGGRVTLCCTQEADALAFAVQDDGPGFAPAVLRGGGQLLHTGDAARSDGHQGLGLYFARRVAESQGGSLTLANTPTGALAVLRLPQGHAPA